ncbi:glycosyltransferase [Protaetiibacter larvae]|uniref:Glycosyltransferase n=1 Tax=Protaetiibacter larvae TaxID=2592654 RepID=A0A5C1YCU2_9MICO|nr:glycosyltransferase [Protaetiibacter larvae]
MSVVIPVYGGELTLAGVVDEVLALSTERRTPDGYPFRVTEVVLVYDNGRDDSARVIRELARQHELVHPVWLSRNYGQHAATLAGMASSGGEWIVTLDEDGQHDPADIPVLLDTALREQAPLVYAKPVNNPSHGFLRNSASRGAKWLLTTFFAGAGAQNYQSYRLVLGSVGRGVAAYAGSGVYLDVALGWVAPPAATAPIRLRDEGERRSGYSARRLFSHFWRMIITSGTRGLRFVSALGAILAAVGVAVTIYLLVVRLTTVEIPEGWASTIVVVLLSSGAILVSIGIIAEYIGVNVSAALGRPAYLVTGDPADGPLGRRRPGS